MWISPLNSPSVSRSNGEIPIFFGSSFHIKFRFNRRTFSTSRPKYLCALCSRPQEQVLPSTPPPPHLRPREEECAVACTGDARCASFEYASADKRCTRSTSALAPTEAKNGYELCVKRNITVGC